MKSRIKTLGAALIWGLVLSGCVTIEQEPDPTPDIVATVDVSVATVLARAERENNPSVPKATLPATRSRVAVSGEFYFPSATAAHIPVGTRGKGYASDQPTSGQHYSVPGIAPTDWGIYSSPFPDEILIHNMEHGGIIAYYRPSAPPAEIEQLRQFISAQPGYPKGFIVAPRASLPADITLAAWEYYLPVFQYDEVTMTAFVSAHYDKGPETLDGAVR